MASSDQSSIKCFVHNNQEDEFNDENGKLPNFVGENPEGDTESYSEEYDEDDEQVNLEFDVEEDPEEDSEDDEQVNLEFYVRNTPEDTGKDERAFLLGLTRIATVSIQLEKESFPPISKYSSDENTNPPTEKVG